MKQGRTQYNNDWIRNCCDSACSRKVYPMRKSKPLHSVHCHGVGTRRSFDNPTSDPVARRFAIHPRKFSKMYLYENWQATFWVFALLYVIIIQDNFFCLESNNIFNSTATNSKRFFKYQLSRMIIWVFHSQVAQGHNQDHRKPLTWANVPRGIDSFDLLYSWATCEWNTRMLILENWYLENRF